MNMAPKRRSKKKDISISKSKSKSNDKTKAVTKITAIAKAKAVTIPLTGAAKSSHVFSPSQLGTRLAKTTVCLPMAALLLAPTVLQSLSSPLHQHHH